MLRRRSLLTVATMAILALGLAVGALAATPKDTLVIGTTDRITQLSFANSYDYWTWHTLQQTTENLVTLEPGTARIAPDLAERWEVSPDGKVYTFYLRRGVRFWDGEPFNAQAMKWALDRNLRLDGPEGGVGLIKGSIDKIEVVDEYTLRITLKAPDATFLARMADPIAPAMATSPRSTPENEFAEGRYAGTGPYRLVQYEPDQRLVLEAYDGYWGPQPKTRRVITVFYADAAALRSAVESGQVDVGFRTFNPEDIVDLSNNPRLKVIKGEGSLSVRYIVFNVSRPPFDDVRVRKAISYAVDRNRIVEDVFSGINTPLYSMVPKGLWSHIEAFPARDLEIARGLLKQAGYSENNKLKLTLWLSPRYGTTEPDVGAVLKANLEETGLIDAEVQSLEWGTYTQRMSEGAFGIFLLGWYPDFIDPDNFLAPWLTESPQGLGTFLDKAVSSADQATYRRFVELLEGAKRVSDTDLRAAMYAEAQRLLADSAVLIPLWQNNQQHLAITQPNIEGLVLDPSMNLRLWLIEKR